MEVNKKLEKACFAQVFKCDKNDHEGITNTNLGYIEYGIWFRTESQTCYMVFSTYCNISLSIS